MKRTVFLAALAVSCTSEPVNVLESSDSGPDFDVSPSSDWSSDSGPGPDVGRNDDADAGLDCGPPMPYFCFRQCGGDGYAPPLCTESGWDCPAGSHKMTDFETYCVGMHTGLCAENHSCEDGYTCAATGRCAYTCFQNPDPPQCATNGCCETIVGGLCSGMTGNFVGCPWDAIPADQCHSCAQADAG